MAYGLHYTTQAFAKSGKLFTAYIYEKDYAGPVDNIAAGFRPFEQNVLASSDDPFEPVLSSDLTTILDITDFTGTIPDLTTRDDKKYHIKLKAGAAPDYNYSTILWRNYQTTTPEYLDCNFQIYVNGQSQVFEFFNNTGELQVNATDTVRLECVVFPPLPTLPIVGAGWRLIVKEDGITIFDTSDQNPSIPSAINYTFVAGYQKVYTVLCYSYQIGDDSTTIPVNTIYDIFQGYLLTDSATLGFNTGRTFLTLPFSDGMGMLKSIPYEQNYATPTVTPQNGAVLVDINTTQTLLEVILQCLNKLELPDGFGLNICVNIYASGMDETQDVFSQISYYRRNWQNQDLTWQDCHTVLTTICRAFGAQIYQANGEYWITNTTDAASGTLRRFKYDQDGTLIGLYTNDASRTVVPYDGTSPHYFVDGNQAKNIRKGYPVIEINSPYTYAPNLIDNGNLKRPATDPLQPVYNWQKSAPVGSVVVSTLGDFVSLELNTSGSSTTYVSPLSIGRVFQNDQLTLSFLVDGNVPIGAYPVLRVQMIAVDLGAGTSYSLNQDSNWQAGASGIYHFVTGTTTNLYERISINTPPLPISCTIYLEFAVVAGGVTMNNTTIADVRLQVTSPNEFKQARGYYDFLSQYKRTQEMQLGMQQDANIAQTGAMIYVTGASQRDWQLWSGWYRYGSTDTFNNLPRLILQQYINIQSAAQINMQGTIMSIFSSNGPISPVNTFYFQDGTTTLPVQGLPYITGNMRINFTDDEWSGTWLQVSETEITEDITDIVIQKT